MTIFGGAAIGIISAGLLLYLLSSRGSLSFPRWITLILSIIGLLIIWLMMFIGLF
jgi:hypothetical protein